jgi:murein lipoprotein
LAAAENESYSGTRLIHLLSPVKSFMIAARVLGNSRLRPTGEETMKTAVLKASVLALALGVAGGCATTEQINEIRSLAERAQSSANAAQQRADSAASTANEALQTAKRAESLAQSAMDCCNQATSRMDKMFEKAMKK